MCNRKILLSDGTHGIVQSVYAIKDSGTKIPPEAIESETLNLGDELKEDGTVIKYVPPVSPPPEPPKPSEVDILKAKVNQLEADNQVLKLDNLTAREALTELYEIVQGGGS